MTKKELRGLGRKELLEMLIEQGKMESLKSEHEKDLEFLKAQYAKEVESLKKELDEARNSLHNRERGV